MISAIVYGKLDYKRSTDTYEFPQYSVAIGWTLAACSVSCIPVVAIYRIIKAEGPLLQVSVLFARLFPPRNGRRLANHYAKAGQFYYPNSPSLSEGRISAQKRLTVKHEGVGGGVERRLMGLCEIFPSTLFASL